MMKSPRTAMTLRALACAMKAKAGILRDADRVALLRDVLVHFPEHAGWRAAVLGFEVLSHSDQAEAGRRLHAWIAGECAGAHDAGRRLEGALDTLDATPRHHAWMDRVDING